MKGFFSVMNTFMETYSTEIIGGLIVSFLLISSKKIVEVVKDYKIRKTYSGYIGDYFLYSFASSGEDSITITYLSIKARFGKLIVSGCVNNNVYEYKGSMSISERNLYIKLTGINHLEQVQLIFHSPLHRKIKNLVGSLNAITVIDEPFASVCILSDKELSEKIIKSEFKKMGIDHKHSMFKVLKDYSLFFNNIEKSENKEKTT